MLRSGERIRRASFVVTKSKLFGKLFVADHPEFGDA